MAHTIIYYTSGIMRPTIDLPTPQSVLNTHAAVMIIIPTKFYDVIILLSYQIPSFVAWPLLASPGKWLHSHR